MAAGRYGLRFSLMEGGVLLAGACAGAFFIFLLGVYVGKEIQVDRAARAGRIARVPVTSSKGGPASRQPEEPLLMWRRRADPPEPLSVSPATTTGTSAGAESARASVVSAPITPARAERPSRPPPVDTSPPAVSRPLSPVGPEAARRWSVQVQATTTPRQAAAVAQRLREAGYRVTVSEVIRRGELWYRVRIGAFSEGQARHVVSRFRRSGDYPQAFLIAN